VAVMGGFFRRNKRKEKYNKNRNHDLGLLGDYVSSLFK